MRLSTRNREDTALSFHIQGRPIQIEPYHIRLIRVPFGSNLTTPCIRLFIWFKARNQTQPKTRLYEPCW